MSAETTPNLPTEVTRKRYIDYYPRVPTPHQTALVLAGLWSKVPSVRERAQIRKTAEAFQEEARRFIGEQGAVSVTTEYGFKVDLIGPKLIAEKYHPFKGADLVASYHSADKFKGDVRYGQQQLLVFYPNRVILEVRNMAWKLSSTLREVPDSPLEWPNNWSITARSKHIKELHGIIQRGSPRLSSFPYGPSGKDAGG